MQIFIAVRKLLNFIKQVLIVLTLELGSVLFELLDLMLEAFVFLLQIRNFLLQFVTVYFQMLDLALEVFHLMHKAVLNFLQFSF